MSEIVTSSEADSVASDLAEARLHLQTCERCQQEFAELEDSFALLAMTAQVDKRADDFTERVFAQIARSTQVEPEKKVAPAISPAAAVGDAGQRLSKRQRWLSIGLAASLLLAVVGGQWWYLHRMHVMAQAIHDPTEVERLESLEQAMLAMRAYEAKAHETQLRFVSFGDVDAKSHVRAYAIFDTFAGQLHFFGFGMKPLPPTSEYALWLLKADGSAELGSTFRAGDNGQANVVATFKITEKDEVIDSPKLLHEVVVTIEDTPLAAQPRGEVWLRSALETPSVPSP